MTAPHGFRTSGFGTPGIGSAAAAPAVGDAMQAAIALRSQGRFQEALEVLSGQCDPPTDAYVLRGDLLVELGRLADAAGSYYTATVSAPGNLYARMHLGSCLRRLGRWEEAVEAFQTVLRADPHRDPIRLELGDCLLHLNRVEQALNCFDQCWSDAAQGQAAFGKGVALQLLRRFDERVWRFSRRLVDINKSSIPGLQGLTLVAVERGDMETAALHFSALAEHVRELVPGSDSSEDTIEYRLNRKAIDRIKDVMRTRPIQPAERRY